MEQSTGLPRKRPSSRTCEQGDAALQLKRRKVAPLESALNDNLAAVGVKLADDVPGYGNCLCSALEVMAPGTCSRNNLVPRGISYAITTRLLLLSGNSFSLATEREASRTCVSVFTLRRCTDSARRKPGRRRYVSTAIVQDRSTPSGTQPRHRSKSLTHWSANAPLIESGVAVRANSQAPLFWAHVPVGAQHRT